MKRKITWVLRKPKRKPNKEKIEYFKKLIQSEKYFETAIENLAKQEAEYLFKKEDLLCHSALQQLSSR